MTTTISDFNGSNSPLSLAALDAAINAAGGIVMNASAIASAATGNLNSIYILSVEPYTRYIWDPSQCSMIPLTFNNVLESAVSAITQALSLTAGINAYNRTSHYGPDTPILNTQSVTKYTLQASDGVADTQVRMNVASPNLVWLPGNANTALPIGFTVPNGLCQYGSGSTGISGDPEVVIRTALSLTLRTQYSVAYISKTGTNEWLVWGDLAQGGAPYLQAPPQVTGNAVANSVLTHSNAVFAGSPTPSIGWIWQRAANGGTAWANIGGTANAATYTSNNPNDVGFNISTFDYASNSLGNASVISNGITIIAPPVANSVPSILAGQPPTISGTGSPGNQLQGSHGTWSAGSNTILGYYYYFYDNNLPVSSNAAQTTYNIQISDAGGGISLGVVAYNSYGNSAMANSVVFPIAGAAPQSSNASAPAIYDLANLYVTGSQLWVDNGGWVGTPTFTFNWNRTYSNGIVQNLGVTTQSYQTVGADANTTIWNNMGVTTSGGTVYVTIPGVFISLGSNQPVNTAAPTLSVVGGGSAVLGSNLTCSNGSWTQSPSFNATYVRVASGGNTVITTNTTGNYTVASADVSAGQIVVIIQALSNGLVGSANSNVLSVTGSGGGSLSIVDIQAGGNVGLSANGVVDFLAFSPVQTSNQVRLNGGGNLIQFSGIGGISIIPNVGFNYGVTWNGGTPVANGTLSAGLSNTWGDPSGAGFYFNIPLGTATRIFDLYIDAYNTYLTVTANTQDGSAANVSVTANSGSGGVTTLQCYRITAAAGTNGTHLIVTATMNETIYGNGQFAVVAASINQ